ncbi:hypothetical protein SAMD00019534_025870 [Acytostelium subglobosum LB1]|uniref:hypothetical protein n=1 Tax=Acytostelium subglobosum LB1 TaxID=1410327 RepID=UPI000644FDE7|nr:hypothetical protein SAMD00019534_025870 [Acytostelium subglobosum LB1]GAM19412.1 hypothetical protein SAMD00019534_025870 [Acytostelium subglobosum LB1]|eukprot:XP_012757339.1 hypothetical protein SAMD00019534_025870 [Acytostelium subglobosum LB1]
MIESTKSDKAEEVKIEVVSEHCVKHNLKQMFLCLDDKELVCQECVTLDHLGHKLATEASLSNKSTPIYVKERDHIQTLWTILKSLSTVHKSHTDSVSQLSQVFQELHTQLNKEEEKLKQPLIKSIKDGESTVEKVIKDLNSTLSLLDHCDGVEHCIVDMTAVDLIKLVNKVVSFGSFMEGIKDSANHTSGSKEETSRLKKLQQYLVKTKDTLNQPEHLILNSDSVSLMEVVKNNVSGIAIIV